MKSGGGLFSIGPQIAEMPVDSASVPLPQQPFPRFQMEPNAPLEWFSPKVSRWDEALPLNEKGQCLSIMKNKIDRTTSEATVRLGNKAEKLRGFREVLCSRVTDREQVHKSHEAVQLELFKEIKGRLLQHANSISAEMLEKPEARDVEKSKHSSNNITWNGRATQKLGDQKLSLILKERKTVPLYSRLQQQNNARSVIKSSLMEFIKVGSALNESDLASEASLIDGENNSSQNSDRKRRKQELEKVQLTQKQRAQLVAEVRKSYMNVERNNVRTRGSVKKNSEIKSISESVSAIRTQKPISLNYIIDVTRASNSSVRRLGEVKSSHNKKTPKVDDKRKASRDINQKRALKKNQVSKTTEKESVRYVTALQRLEVAPSICSCPKNLSNECANNCELYKNPRQAERLAKSNVYQSQLSK